MDFNRENVLESAIMVAITSQLMSVAEFQKLPENAGPVYHEGERQKVGAQAVSVGWGDG